MDALWSIGLAHTYLAHLDYLVVQCSVHTTYFSFKPINDMGSQTHHYVKFLLTSVGYMPLGAHVVPSWL